jgi:hypothetical protein
LIDTIIQKEKKTLSEKPSHRSKYSPFELFDRYAFSGIVILFFVCYFLFLLGYVNPAVIFSTNGINIHNYVAIMHTHDASTFKDLLFNHHFILELTPEYFQKIALTPGGWTTFLLTVCIFACYNPVIGALVVTGLALLFYCIFTFYIKGVGVKQPLVFSLVPAFFLLITCAWYELSYCAFLLPVAGALLFALFYQHLESRKIITNILFISVTFWLAWYFIQWGCFLVLLFVVIHEIFNQKKMVVPVALFAIVNGAVFYIVDKHLIPIHMSIHWSDFTTLSGLPIAVIGFFPLSALVLAIMNRVFRPLMIKLTLVVKILQLLLLMCGTAIIVTWLCKDTINRDTRILARTVHHTINEKWDAILHEKTTQMFHGFPQTSGPLQIFMVHAVDHALYRTGQLNEKLFAYPQASFSYDPLIMLKSMSVSVYVNWIMVLDVVMDLGMVNTAEKIAGELMENMGPYPETIYRRALIQIAKGNSDAGAVYLNKLTSVPFYRNKAKKLLSKLNSNEILTSDPSIASMYINKDTVDYLLNHDYDCGILLKYLLESNPKNKMAYDYLMSFCLLKGRLDEVANLKPLSPEFGYKTVPRYWQEALCIYQNVASKQSSSSTAISGISQDTQDRFKKITQEWRSLKGDSKAAEKLASEFGDSFFYYFIFKYCVGTVHE